MKSSLSVLILAITACTRANEQLASEPRVSEPRANEPRANEPRANEPGPPIERGCGPEAAALGASLQSGLEEPNLFQADELGLVVRADLPDKKLRSAPYAKLSPAGMWYRGHTLSAAQLRDQLDVQHRKLLEDLAMGKVPPHGDPPDPAKVYFVIDEKTPWSIVVTAVGAAEQAGMRSPGFVFEIVNPAKPPPRSSIDPKLDALDRDLGNRASNYVNLVKEQIAPCPALVQAFYRSDSYSTHLVDALVSALVVCDCKIDVPALHSLLWRWLVTLHPVRAIEFTADAPRPPLALPGTTTWADASKRLTPDTKGASFVVQ